MKQTLFDKGRKGMLLLTLTILGVIIGFIAFLVISTGETAEREQGFIGENALAILRADQKAQLVLAYIDMAAIFATREGLLMLAEYGGIVAENPCGTYAGYSVWQTPLGDDQHIERCVPERFDGELSSLISALIDIYAQNLRVSDQATYETYQIPLDNYEITLREQGGRLDVIGNPRDDLYFQVRRDRVVAYTPQATVTRIPAVVSAETTSREGTIQEEEGDEGTMIPPQGQLALDTAPECAPFGQGMQLYRGDEKIMCGRQNTGTCCMQAPLVAQLERTKRFITSPGDNIYISAARTPASQRRSYLDYLAGGAAGCGPESLATEHESIRRDVMAYVRSVGEDPARTSTRRRRAEIIEGWLEMPQGRAFKPVIDDLRQYSHCKHVGGFAIDVKLQNKDTWEEYSAEEQRRVREVMCRAGWANFGGEFWHYEYANERWETSRAQMPEDTEPFTDGGYHESCYFSTLSWGVQR